jgi:hypothetical protein
VRAKVHKHRLAQRQARQGKGNIKTDTVDAICDDRCMLYEYFD